MLIYISSPRTTICSRLLVIVKATPSKMQVLDYSEDDVCKVRKYYEVTSTTIQQNIGILRTWIQQQPHLPQNQDDGFLERLLLRNKFRIEKSKEKLEAYYTMKGLCREFYEKCNKDFVPSLENSIVLPVPRLTSKQERVYITRMENTDPELYDVIRIIKFSLLLMEITMRVDYAIGERIIVDCRGCTLEHLKRIPTTELARVIGVYTKAYSGRPISVEIVNAPAFINVLLNLLKMVFPAKLYNRVNIHNDLESLQKNCSKECLPEDYGGDLPPIAELKKNWDKVYENYQKMFDALYDEVADDALRVGDVMKDDNFGVEGTFKKLNLD